LLRLELIVIPLVEDWFFNIAGAVSISRPLPARLELQTARRRMPSIPRTAARPDFPRNPLQLQRRY
jgi:hypothetical protein